MRLYIKFLHHIKYVHLARMTLNVKMGLMILCTSLFAVQAVAQQTETVNTAAGDEKAVTTPTSESATANSSVNAPLKADAGKVQANKKMVQDATISLQTTITGNQEQPKVLYILPWQSPQTTDVDFEPLDNQQKAVFNHVERDELRRELDVSDELQ